MVSYELNSSPFQQTFEAIASLYQLNANHRTMCVDFSKYFRLSENWAAFRNFRDLSRFGQNSIASILLMSVRKYFKRYWIFMTNTYIMHMRHTCTRSTRLKLITHLFRHRSIEFIRYLSRMELFSSISFKPGDKTHWIKITPQKIKEVDVMLYYLVVEHSLV